MTRSVMGPSHPHQQVGEYSAGGAGKRAAASLAVGAESCCQGRSAARRAAAAMAPARKLRVIVMVFLVRLSPSKSYALREPGASKNRTWT